MENLEQFDTEEKIKAALDALSDKYKRILNEQRASKLAQAKAIINTYSFSIEELGFSSIDLNTRQTGLKMKRTRRTAEEIAADRTAGRAKAAYRDPETGIEWSGKGRRPNVFKDKNMADYLIQQPA